MPKLSGLIIDMCWGACAGFSPQTTPTVSSFTRGCWICHQERPPTKGEDPEHHSWNCLCNLLVFIHDVTSPLGCLPVPLNFGDGSPTISEMIWIAQCIYFHRGHRKQPACLLDTKQTPSLPNTPLSVITKKMQCRAQSIISNFSWRKLI